MKSMFLKNPITLLALGLLSACQPGNPVPPLSKPSAQPTPSPALTPLPEATASTTPVPQATVSATPLPASTPTSVATGSPTPSPLPTPAPESFRPKQLEITGRISNRPEAFLKGCGQLLELVTSTERLLAVTSWSADGGYSLSADLYSVEWGDLPLMLRPRFVYGQSLYAGEGFSVPLEPDLEKLTINGSYQQAAVLPAPTPPPSDLAIVQKTRILGRVFDEEGIPVSGATVHVSSLNSSVPYEAEQKTLENGAYILNSVPVGIELEVSVRVCGKILQSRKLTTTLCNYDGHWVNFGVNADLLPTQAASDSHSDDAHYAVIRSQMPACSSSSGL